MKTFLKLASMMIIASGVMLNVEGMYNAAENNQSQQMIISNPMDPYIALNGIAEIEVKQAKRQSLTKDQCIQNTIGFFLDHQEILIQNYRQNNIQFVTLDEPAVRNAVTKIIEWRWNPTQQDNSVIYEFLNVRSIFVIKHIDSFPFPETVTTLQIQSSPDDPYMVAECTAKALADAYLPNDLNQRLKDTYIDLAVEVSKGIIKTDLVNVFGESRVVKLEEPILRDRITSIINDMFNQIQLNRAQIRRDADNRRTNNHRH